MAAIGGGAGHAQGLAADQATKRHEAGQAGGAVVGLAAGEGECLGVDGDRVVAAGRCE